MRLNILCYLHTIDGVINDHCLPVKKSYYVKVHISIGKTKDIVFLIIRLNPFKPEFTIVIFIHYKPRIAVAILDL